MVDRYFLAMTVRPVAVPPLASEIPIGPLAAFQVAPKPDLWAEDLVPRNFTVLIAESMMGILPLRNIVRYNT